MTRSPLTATLLPLAPLAALGWPLAKVINQEPYQQTKVEKSSSTPLLQADLEIKAAHPFKMLEVSTADTTWIFNAGEDIKTIYLPKDLELIFTVTATWPEGIPESAILLTLKPDGRPDRNHTLWGFLELTEEIKFTWDR
jgi:hypothetical protein